jgi:hypothetical protein
MTEASIDIARTAWQVTAATVYCDIVNDYVTIMVYGDWSSKCTWFNTNKDLTTKHPKQKNSKDIKDGVKKCQGPDCKHIKGYRDKLILEEIGKATINID